ncbi:hypothetical protein HDU97_004937 [Phlyctochytrium planicorne]|nr:hypothetical protein HDU97_004937 [Phlyctochytrium planicorne]
MLGTKQQHRPPKVIGVLTIKPNSTTIHPNSSIEGWLDVTLFEDVKFKRNPTFKCDLVGYATMGWNELSENQTGTFTRSPHIQNAQGGQYAQPQWILGQIEIFRQPKFLTIPGELPKGQNPIKFKITTPPDLNETFSHRAPTTSETLSVHYQLQAYHQIQPDDTVTFDQAKSEPLQVHFPTPLDATILFPIDASQTNNGVTAKIHSNRNTWRSSIPYTPLPDQDLATAIITCKNHSTRMVNKLTAKVLQHVSLHTHVADSNGQMFPKAHDYTRTVWSMDLKPVGPAGTPNCTLREPIQLALPPNLPPTLSIASPHDQGQTARMEVKYELVLEAYQNIEPPLTTTGTSYAQPSTLPRPTTLPRHGTLPHTPTYLPIVTCTSPLTIISSSKTLLFPPPLPNPITNIPEKHDDQDLESLEIHHLIQHNTTPLHHQITNLHNELKAQKRSRTPKSDEHGTTRRTKSSNAKRRKP